MRCAALRGQPEAGRAKFVRAPRFSQRSAPRLRPAKSSGGKFWLQYESRRARRQQRRRGKPENRYYPTSLQKVPLYKVGARWPLGPPDHLPCTKSPKNEAIADCSIAAATVVPPGCAKQKSKIVCRRSARITC